MDRLLIAVPASYAVSCVLLVLRRRRAGLALFVLGTVAAWGLLGVEWSRTGHPPLANLFHVMLFLSGCFLPVYAQLAWRRKLGWLGPYFAGAAALPALYAALRGRPDVWYPPAALQSAWWIPHVSSYIFSYALATVAFLLIVAVFLQTESGQPSRRSRLEDASYRVMALAFPLMTFGLVSGALWADQAWGRYWDWDPKETWSLITWTLYVMYFHCRRTSDLRRFAAPVQILAFLALLVTFILVNVLPKFAGALHSYA